MFANTMHIFEVVKLLLLEPHLIFLLKALKDVNKYFKMFGALVRN